LFNVNGAFTDEVEKQYAEALTLCQDVLIVQMINVRPKFRGRDLGLRAFEHVARTFGGGCGVAAYIPCAMQFSHKAKENPEYRASFGTFRIRTEKAAMCRVVAHWARLGGKPLNGTDLWIIITSDIELFPAVKPIRPH
jgi:hypothetical protein